MFAIDKTGKIKVVKGDTGRFDLVLDNYVLKEGDKAYFTVKKSYKDAPVIQKIVSTFDELGTAMFLLMPEETYIEAGTYLYDVQVSLMDGTVDTVVLPNKFQVLEGVTDNE